MDPSGGRADILDLMVYDGLYEKFYGYHMGITAENIAATYGISRHEQDEISLLSHQRARKTIADGIFKKEIIPVMVSPKKGQVVPFDTDERPMDTSMKKMAKLSPAFKKDGTVTAGNASGISDAAAALLMSRGKAKQLNLKPMAVIKSYASGGIDHTYIGVGVIPAVKKALKKASMTIKDIDLIELNEAFASQAIACIRELGMSLDNTNMYGSGISIGHPVGCTGARLLVTIIHSLERLNKKTGLVTMCIGGGQGMAMIVERP